jgi:hypothetical protein
LAVASRSLPDPLLCAGSSRRSILRPFDPASLVESCCPFGPAKFLDVRSVWSLPPRAGKGKGKARPVLGRLPDLPTLAKGLAAALPTRDIADSPVSCLAARAVLRGVAVAGEAAPVEPAPVAVRDLQRALHPVPWNAAPLAVGLSYEPQAAAVRGVGVAANRTHMAALVGRVLDKASVMESARAYVHWYERFGIEAEDLHAAFDALRRIAEAYRDLEAPQASASTAALRRIRDMT